MSDVMDTETADGIVLTDEAASKVKTLLEAEGRDDLTLRIAVQPGGCSGLRYQLFFDDRNLDMMWNRDQGLQRAGASPFELAKRGLNGYSSVNGERNLMRNPNVSSARSA